MSYYYDDVYGADGYASRGDAYGDYGASADLYGGVREAKSGKARHASGKERKPRTVHPRTQKCFRLPERKSDKPMTPQQKARRKRSEYLSRRCEKRAYVLSDMDAKLRAAKKARDEPSVIRIERAVAHVGARLGRDQSKRRAFLERTNGFDAQEFYRSPSGYVVDRELHDRKKDLKNKHGRFLIDYEPHTNINFRAWKEAVKAVKADREGAKPHHPEKKGVSKKTGLLGPKALLAKKNGDVYEAEYYREIKAHYDILKESPEMNRLVDAFNERADAHNTALKNRSVKNKEVLEAKRAADKARSAQEKAAREARRSEKEAAPKSSRAKVAEPLDERKLRRSKSAKSKERIVKVTAVPVGRSTKPDAKQARAAASQKQIKLTKPKSPKIAPRRSMRLQKPPSAK